MRQIVIAGNWKMNKGPLETQELIGEMHDKIRDIKDHVHVVICPPFISLSAASDALKKMSAVDLGAQNVHFEKTGAFTGEVSAEMLNEIGCNYVIIGHSERREYFHEEDEMINKKVLRSIDAGLKVILCVGEKLEERKSATHFQVVETQIENGLKDVPFDRMRQLIIAYEPVWAIGTGETASPEQAQEMHAFIRSKLNELYGESVAFTLQILYGGSMKPNNAFELLQQKDVDGGLIGGASLDAEQFGAIIEAANQQR